MADDMAIDFSTPLRADAEDLEIEFKRSLPLADKEGKAKLAKEICALANHGGGWLVLGREDDGTYPPSLPEDLNGSDQDRINQIVTTYLSPTPHCSVRWMKPDRVEFDVLVVRVPNAGIAPVCGNKNGPNDENGRSIGIRKGVHYIRKAGPVSAPIESPDEWQAVIRRCVLSDKAALLSALTTMIEQPSTTPQEATQSVLDADFERLVEKWKAEAVKYPYDVDLTNNFVGYAFHLIDAAPVTIEQIRECLRARPPDTKGAHEFFDDRYPTPSAPIVMENAGIDGIEVDAFMETFDMKSAWRLSEALSGVEVISFWEDTEYLKSAVEHQSSRTWERGEKIWMMMQITLTNKFLIIVKHVADFFKYDGEIRIRVKYHGLKGRSLDSPRPSAYYSLKYEAHQDTKQVDITLEKGALEPEAKSATIAAIIQQMNKLTQGPKITAEGVVKALLAL